MNYYICKKNMRLISGLFILLLFSSCKSSTDKLIDSYEDKVDALSAATETKDMSDPEVDKLRNEISELIDQISAADLTDDQQTRVTGISLKLQVTLMALDKDMSNSLDNDLNTITNGLDSIGTMMGEFDSLSIDTN